MVYDADGDRLIRRDSAGYTLYLPDGVEVHVDGNGANALVGALAASPAAPV